MNSSFLSPKYLFARAGFYSACILLTVVIFSSCNLGYRINKKATTILFKDSIIAGGHIGITIYEPAANKYWYQYNAANYFLPASNVKLFTLYAAMKYLGDSLVGLRYQQKDSNLVIFPTADPTFLHPDFNRQPVFNFLKGKTNIRYCSQLYTDGLGKGWAWDDYMDDYMVQKSEFPIYGNLIRVYNNAGTLSSIPKTIHLDVQKGLEKYNGNLEYTFYRTWDHNDVFVSMKSFHPTKNIYTFPLVPQLYEVPEFIADTLHQKIEITTNKTIDSIKNNDAKLSKIFSQPTDSILKPMLYNSDNFFAEQSLLMVSNERLGYMSTDAIIDTLLKNDLQDLPQKPRWADGSGLSRYNLFTPQSFIFILNKLKNEFGIARLKRILPTGGEGTLKNYYLNDSSFIFAKTGSMSNNTAISGFIYSKKGKLLIFSVLANQFVGSATKVRHSVEKFLDTIREGY